MFDELLKSIWAWVTKALSRTQVVVLAAFAVCAAATSYVLRESVPIWQVLAVSSWLLIGIWFVAIVKYRRKRRLRKRRLAPFLFLSVITLLWIFLIVRDFTTNSRRVNELMNHTATFVKESNYGSALDEVKEAYDIARTAGIRDKEMDCLAQMAEVEFVLGKPESQAHFQESLKVATELNSSAGKGRANLGLGIMQYTLGQQDEAQSYFNQAIENYRDTDKRGYARAIASLGRSYNSQAYDDKAREQFDIADKLYSKLGDEEGQAEIREYLGELQHSEKKLPDALRNYQAAQQVFEKNKDKLAEAEVLSLLGDYYSDIGRLDLALRYYLTAKGIYYTIGSPLGEGRVCNGLGDLEMERGNLSEANNLYEQGLALFKEINDELDQASILLGKGTIESFLCDFEAAERDLKDAKMKFENTEGQKGTGDTLTALGDLELNRQMPSKARRYFEEANEVFKQTGEERGQADAYRGLGDAERMERNYPEANAQYAKAKAIYDGQDENIIGQGDVLKGMGLIELNQNIAREAKTLLDQAKNKYDEAENKIGEADTLVALAEWEKRFGNKDLAQKDLQDAGAIYSEVGSNCQTQLTELVASSRPPDGPGDAPHSPRLRRTARFGPAAGKRTP